jgi:LemA protein
MTTFDDKLNKHIDKVLELQNSQKEKMLTLEELKELDMSLGVSEEEWNQMMEKANKDVELAQNHFYYKNYSEAYTTAESALSINPHLTRALVLMADSALKIYESEDNEDFLLKAEKHAKEVLKQAPAENRAIEILSILNTYKKEEKAQRTKIFRIIAGIVGIVLIVVVIMVWPREEKVYEPDQSVRFELIEAEESANAKWAQVENVITRRDKLIPQLMAVVETRDESIDLLNKEIDAIKKEITSAGDGEKVDLQSKLQEKYEELTALISKKYQDDHIATLLIQIEGSYNRIAVEGKRYNEAVKTYNILVKKHAEEFTEFETKAYFKGQ